MTRGIFVVLDGPDGSGKTTQRIQVFTKLMKLGLKVATTAEPGATRIGKAIKKLILNKANKISVETETCLFLADRIAHLQNFVYPELEKNDVVICDRYTPSTVVYQSLVKGFSFEDLSQLNKILKIPEADLTFIFKVSEADQTRRLHQFRTELDMYEDDPEFRKQVISAFNELADRNNYETVDGSLDRDVITKQIVERILLERNK